MNAIFTHHHVCPYRVLHMRASDGQHETPTVEAPSTNDEIQSIMSQSQSNDAPIASYGSSNSNNVLTSIQSGSLKRFNRMPRSVRNAGDEDSDEDDANDVSRYHDCNEPLQSVFAPISTSQPAFNPYEHASTSSHTRHHDDANPPHQRIAVAALPNLEFDQFTMSRGFSASSPSLYSQPESTSRRNSNESDPRRKNFARNATASSSNYFM